MLCKKVSEMGQEKENYLRYFESDKVTAHKHSQEKANTQKQSYT